MILCEKPLSMDTAEGETMCAAVEKAGVPNTVWYNYRRIPAVTFAKQLIDSGRLGRIFHYRAKFLQDWTINADLPQGGAALWRLDAKAAGSGVTGDLLAHCIDTAIWLNGHVKDVTAMTETFVKERTHQLTGKKEPVEIDDACAFLCHFENGSLGLFESTRYARGHKALYTFEINGENHEPQVGSPRPPSAPDLRLQPMPGRSGAGRASMSPTATIPTWTSGGCRAWRSATSTRSCTRWPTSSRPTPRASPATRPSATPSRPRRSATRS